MENREAVGSIFEKCLECRGLARETCDRQTCPFTNGDGLGKAYATEEPLLTPKDLARLLKVSSALPYKMADRGQLPCVRIPCIGPGGRSKALLRFRRSDVMAFVEAHYRHFMSPPGGK
jgi:excisionase family DNA binding protein